MAKLHLTTEHTGKMKGMASISTSVLCNDRCKANAKVKGSICEKCYAARMMKMYKNMRGCMERNFEILTTTILEDDELPILNYAFFRIESFGDIANVTQAINYLNLIRKNPHVFFGWWTKNVDLIDKALKQTGYEKPENVNIIQSSRLLNVKEEPKYDWVDKVFTVYQKDADVKINCGARSCLKCHKCYERNDIKYVNEILK